MTERSSTDHHSGARPPGAGGASSGPGPEPSDSFSALFEALPDATLIVDITGCIVRANQIALTLFCCPPPLDLRNLTISDLVSGFDRSLLDQLFANTKTQIHSKIQAHCIRSNKTTFPCDMSVTGLSLDKDYLVFFVRDITDERKLEKGQEEGKG